MMMQNFASPANSGNNNNSNAAMNGGMGNLGGANANTINAAAAAGAPTNLMNTSGSNNNNAVSAALMNMAGGGGGGGGSLNPALLGNMAAGPGVGAMNMGMMNLAANAPGVGGGGMNLAAAAQAMNMNAAMQNFNFDDFKRLQQLQQLQNLTAAAGTTAATTTSTTNVSSNDGGMQGSNAPAGSGLIGAGGMMGVGMQQQQQQNNLAALQSYLDQKIQTERLGGVTGMGALTGQNPMLFGQANLLHERLMMNQNPMAALGGVGGGNTIGAINVGGAAPSNTGGASEVPLPSPHSLFHRDGSRRMRGGVIEPFPEKLHRLLLEVEAAGRGDVISFVANGRAFAIHKPDKFFKEIVPLYFRQSRLSSFKRQLNLYGFELINTGPARGGYYHELFVKDRPELCRRMRRVAVKVTPKDGVDDPIKGEKEQSKDTVDTPKSTSAKKEDKIEKDTPKKEEEDGSDDVQDSTESKDDGTPSDEKEEKEGSDGEASPEDTSDE